MVAAVRRLAPEIASDAVYPDGSIKPFKLSDHRGKYTVIFFFPLSWTFVCPSELVAFSDRIADFKALGVEIAAVSIDSPFTNLAWTKAPRNVGGVGKLEYPLVSDVSHQICRDYGVEIDIEGDADRGVAFRGLFIIDPKGIVRQITINDLPVGRSVDETLRLLQAFQFTDKHGEVCPANWRPGQKTIKPDPVGSQEYFGSLDNGSESKKRRASDGSSNDVMTDVSATEEEKRARK